MFYNIHVKWILQELFYHTDKEVTVMISNVYNYYLSQYGNLSYGRHNVHKKMSFVIPITAL